jgi:ABC-2 type transport system ATP-binding protein
MDIPDRDTVIEVRDLVKTFSADTRAVDHVTFSVGHGELFGFLGPNGAGKTTTIRILATLLRPTSGSARVAGFDVLDEPQEVRRRLGLAMQTPSLDQFSTGRETLELAGRLHRVPAAEIRRRADELLELMGLAAAAKKLTGTYSGGMKRRLDLASALMHRPPLLILDEPTEGLDPQSRTALWEELARINAEGTTMLLTTHYMEEADRLCSRLAIIDDGQIVVQGDPGALKAGIGADTVVLQLEGAEGGRGRESAAGDNGGRRIEAASDDGRGSEAAGADGHGSEAAGDRRGDGRSQAAGGDRHGSETAGDDVRVAEVCRLLEGMIGCEAVSPHPAGVSLAVTNAGAAIPELMRRLDGNGLQITGLQMSQPSLDDVFMKYTGRHIREESADQPIVMGWP